MNKMNFLTLMVVVLLCSGLLIFVPSTARALPVGTSDVLTVTFGTFSDSRTIIEEPGEDVTAEIIVTIPRTDQFDSRNNTVVYLVEPGTVTATDPSTGKVTGDQSDEVRLNITGGPGQVTELHFTIRSDETGRGNSVTGYLENGELRDITADLFGTTLGDITAQIQVASDVEVVPEPITLLLIGSGLVGLAGIRRFMK